MTKISKNRFGIALFRGGKVVGHGLDLYDWPDQACDAAERLSNKLRCRCYAGFMVR